MNLQTSCRRIFFKELGKKLLVWNIKVQRRVQMCPQWNLFHNLTSPFSTLRLGPQVIAEPFGLRDGICILEQ
jgi:hypothetical protein